MWVVETNRYDDLENGPKLETGHCLDLRAANPRFSRNDSRQGQSNYRQPLSATDSILLP